MDTDVLLKLIYIILLVIGNAFFVGSEIALTSARRSRIKQLADMGNKAAKRVQLLHKEPERFYSVTQIGITLVSLALGAIGMTTINDLTEPGFQSLAASMGIGPGVAHTASYSLAFVIISFLHVVAGELAPKVLAFHKAETLSLAVAWIVDLMYVMGRPVIWVMNHSSNGLLWCFGQSDLAGHGEGHFSMTEEEIRSILLASEAEGVLNSEETKMIRGVFDLDEHTVREAMIPRTDILAMPKTATLDEALVVFKEHPHARFPVFSDDLDDMVGMLAMKEVLRLLAEDDPEIQRAKKVEEIMKEVLMVPETKPLSELLKEFQGSGSQMAIVVDEFGGTAGIISLEDILEEIVGEYDDEFTKKNRYIKKGEGSQYVIDASIRVSELETTVNFPFPEGDYVTLGGLIFQRIGRVPKEGDVVNLEAGRLEVLSMDRNRVATALFQDLALGEDGKPRLAETVKKGDAPDAPEKTPDEAAKEVLEAIKKEPKAPPKPHGDATTLVKKAPSASAAPTGGKPTEQ